jgi:CDP-archaeol synthase
VRPILTVMDWAKLLWLASPVILGGATHVAVLKFDVGAALARLPIDGGLRYRGQPLLGRNKTWRGALVMVVATTVFAHAQASLWHCCEWGRSVSLIDFDRIGPTTWGVLLGSGYIVGELPNSFLKRRLGVPPGEPGSGWRGPLFWVTDQLDSWAGVVAAMCVVWVPPVAVILGLAIVTLAVHPAMALAMVVLGLKGRIG